jgi:hypothetical protein
MTTGHVVQLPDGRFKVAEHEAALFASQLQAAQLAEAEVKASFLAKARDLGLGVDGTDIWDDFERLFLHPLAQQLGATLYELLTTSSDPSHDVLTYGDITSPICDKYGPATPDLISSFLDPSDRAVRTYVLAHLNACYLREALALDSSVIARLQESHGRPEEARIFLDTNFLFSFLGIHDNSGKQVALELRDLVNTVHSSIKITLYALPDTIQQARRVLGGVSSWLEGVRTTGNLAQAASLLKSQGLVTSFLTAASKHPGLNSAEYFGVYEKNLLTILRDNGVELYNEDTSALHVDQAVIDDVHAISEWQKAHAGEAKTYEVNLHDMVLWHFVERRRPRTMDSPIDAGNWICTLDLRFLAFDRRKRAGGLEPPICLAQAGLIQLIQFWLPRSDALDAALVGSMREPLMFLRFDDDTEAATVKILKAMSRLQGMEGLSLDTTFRVLTNEALRSRVQPTTTEPEVLELVESAVIAEAAQLERRVVELEKSASAAAPEQLRAAEQEAQRLREVASSAGSEVAALKASVAELGDQLNTAKEDAAKEEAKIASERDQLRDRVSALELQTKGLKRARETWVLTLQMVGVLVVAALVCFGLSEGLLHAWKVPWLSWSSGATFAGLLVLLALEWLLGRHERFRDLRTHTWVKRSRKVLQAALGVIVLSVVAGLIVNALGHHSPHKG